MCRTAVSLLLHQHVLVHAEKLIQLLLYVRLVATLGLPAVGSTSCVGLIARVTRGAAVIQWLGHRVLHLGHWLVPYTSLERYGELGLVRILTDEVTCADS